MDTVDNLALNIPEASQKELLKQGRISAFCIQTQVFLQRLQFELAYGQVLGVIGILQFICKNGGQKMANKQVGSIEVLAEA